MKLSQFIAEALKEIIDGTVDAQTYATKVGAKVHHGDLIVHTNNHMRRVALLGGEQIAQVVEFSLAVCVPNHDTEDAKTSPVVHVGSMGMDDFNRPNTPDAASCRVRFTIPIGLPLQKK